MSIADIKANARRALHGALSVFATLQPYGGGVPVQVSVRWHSKNMLYGADASDGYAQTIEGVDHVVFNMDELSQAGVAPKRGDRVIMPASYQGATLVLQEMEPVRGPVTQKWRVSQE